MRIVHPGFLIISIMLRNPVRDPVISCLFCLFAIGGGHGRNLSRPKIEHPRSLGWMPGIFQVTVRGVC